jgi:hypothetical protein
MESSQKNQNFIIGEDNFRIPTCSKGHKFEKKLNDLISFAKCQSCKSNTDSYYICETDKEQICLRCFIKEKNRGILSCPKKHELNYRDILEEYSQGFGCDNCNSEFKNPLNASWNCKTCQYDLCIYCYSKLINEKKKEVFPVYQDLLIEGLNIFKIQNLEQASDKIRNFNVKSYEEEKKWYFNKMTKVDYSLDNQKTFGQYNGKPVSGITGNGFFDAFYLAWALHGNLVISPDDIWLQIMHNVQVYINNNAEQLRSKLVSHEGKMKLIVKVMGWDFESLITGFTEQISQNTKENIVNLFQCDFSCSGEVEKLASYTCIMSSCRKYFDYEGQMCVCGLKYVTLQGERKDWEYLREKIVNLNKLFPDLYWASMLSNHIEKFINLFDKKFDLDFWNNVILEKTVIERIGTGCYGMGGFKEVKKKQISGWILDFFPYDSDGADLWKRNLVYNDIPRSISYCPVTIVDHFSGGKKLYYLFANAFNGVLEMKLDQNVLSYKPITDVCIGPCTESTFISFDGIRFKIRDKKPSENDEDW